MKTLAIIATLSAGMAAAQDGGPDWVNTFIEDVQACWIVSEGDTPWPSVTVQFRMDRDAKPVIDSFELLDASAAGEDVTQAAFAAVRRAVIRCGDTGYDLPTDAYDQWDDIVITFDPRAVVLP